MTITKDTQLTEAQAQEFIQNTKPEDVTFDQYLAMTRHAIQFHMNIFIASDCFAFQAIAEFLTAVEAAHPTFEDQMADGQY